MIVSPHFDDAVLSAFTLLRSGVARVVNVFTGAPATGVTDWDRQRGFATSADHMAARVQEEHTVMERLSIPHTALGFVPVEYRRDGEALPDGALVQAVTAMADTDGTIALPVGAGGLFSLGQKIQHRLRPQRRAGGTTPHIDHLAVTDLLAGPLLDLGHEIVLYEDLPYLWAKSGDDRAAAIATQHGCIINEFSYPVDRDDKAAAINLYASQAGAIVLRPPHLVADALPNTERFWHLTH